MSELASVSRDDNHLRSVEAFVRAHIEIALGITVYYQYQNVPSAINRPNHFIVPTLVPLGPIRDATQAGANSLSTWSEASIDLNIYERSDAIGLDEVNRFTLVTLATNVKNLFQLRTAIPIYDYGTSGNPQVGAFVIREEPRRVMVQTSDEDAVRQANVIVPLRYHSVVENIYS